MEVPEVWEVKLLVRKWVVRGTDGIWEGKSVLQLIKLTGKVGVERTDTDKACCKVGKNHSFSQEHAVTIKCYNDPVLEWPLFSYWKTLFSNIIEYPKCCCLKLYQWKRNTLLCLEVQAGGEGATEDDMVGWHHWASSGRWWWRGKSVLQSMGSQRVRHNWATEQQQHPLARLGRCAVFHGLDSVHVLFVFRPGYGEVLFLY